MGVKGRSNSFDSAKIEVGEIDTRAPFESVKAAVSLFGEVAFSGDKSTGRKTKAYSPTKAASLPRNPSPEQRAFATESQLHLAQKELNKLKEQLQTAETTRAQALTELEKAKKTVLDLTLKLTTINESKEQALKAAEAAKAKTTQLNDESSQDGNPNGKLELEQSREQYSAAMMELDAAKQELRRLRKEFEASTEAKNSAHIQETEAKQQSEANTLKAEQLSKEIAAVQESLAHVKLATDQAHEQESKIRFEKDATRDSYRLALEETETKLAELKKDFNPELHKELEEKLADTDAGINAIRKQLDDAHASDIESLNAVTSELDAAKQELQKVAEEESSVRSMVESLKLELETVTKQHDELKEKDAETETLVADLHIKLQNCKTELESAIAAESKASSESNNMTMTLQQLKLESESALQEAEAMKKEAEAMREEAASIRASLSETEMKLELALKEAEAAKAAEAQAVNEIKNLSSTRSSTSVESGAAEITISKDEFESLNRKVEESEKLTEMKVAAAAAQVEAVKASEAEAAKRLEATRKEIEEIEAARVEALKRAEMAEAAKKAVEGELRRWREKEEKRASEMAARLLPETSPPMSSRALPPLDRGEGSKKFGQKPSLLPRLSGIFHRHKKGDGSPFHV